jgi:hypothetical protein
MSDVVKKQIAAYQENFILHGNTPKGTFQNNILTQEERFKQLIDPLLSLKPEGFSLCDIGSGICDLHKYLVNNGVNHEYTGIEIVPEMVAYAKHTYPAISVLNTDFLQDSFSQNFDFFVVSGTFNIPGDVKTDEWEEFIYKVVYKMFSLAKIGISFNSLTTYSTFKDDSLFYLKPEDMFSFIQKNLSRFCHINTGYPLYEVSYTVLKKDYLSSKYNQADYLKYFK